MEIKVTVYTRAYNTEKYIRQCIESVLSQTHSNFEYILIDNGCTDGSSQIMQDYAEKDRRIQLIRFEKNSRICASEIIQKYGSGSYVTNLDSDDWWEPTYLERLVKLAADTNADIVSTGTLMHIEGTEETSARQLNRAIMLDDSQYAESFPFYHVFFRTTWAKLIRTKIYLNGIIAKGQMAAMKSNYGADTLTAFAHLRKAKRIYLDNSVLHHYRIHKRSSSYHYDSGRFASDICLYNDAVNFLSAYGPISEQNRQFLQAVYSNAITDTIQVIHNARLSPAEKLKEYSRIALHPLTQAAYSQCRNESASRSKNLLMQFAIEVGASLNSQFDDDLYAIFQTLTPNCAKALLPTDLGLFVREPELQKSLGENDRERLACQILSLISQKQYTKQYDLGQMLCGMISDDCPLHGISDTRFFRDYAESCMLILGKKYSEALDQMTGILFQKKRLYAGETFLNLYLTISALEGEIPAFLFGKLQLARLCLDQERLPECRSVIDELVEMGVESEELDALQKRLKEISG